MSDLIYMTDGSTIYEYGLSSPFDISTASLSESTSASGPTQSLSGFTASPDGDFLYGVDSSDDGALTKWELSTPFELSSISQIYYHELGSTNSTWQDVFFNDDGTQLYIGDTFDQNVEQHNIATAYDAQTSEVTASGDKNEDYSNDFSTFSKTYGHARWADGGGLLWLTTTSDKILKYTAGTAYDVGSLTYTNTDADLSSFSDVVDLRFHPDGTSVFTIDNGNDEINEISLSTKWDLTTASSEINSFDVSGQTSNPEAFVINATTVPTALQVSGTTTTSVSLSWRDNSSQEDNYIVERAKEVNGVTSTFRDIATLAAGTESYTDSTVQPNRTYTYRVRAENQSGVIDTSTPVTATTSSTSVRQSRVPSSGWYVEIDTAGGQTIQPRLLDDPEIRQTVNGLPELRIPVVQADKWQTQAFEDAPVRAWYNGARQPVEQLAAVEQLEGDEQSRTILVAEGGVELRTRVEKSVGFRDAHKEVRDLVQNNTSYATNVDNPASTTSEVQMQSADSQSEFTSVIPATPFASTKPVEITSGGTVKTLQSTFYVEGENASGPVSRIITDGAMSNGKAMALEGNGGGTIPSNFVGEYIEETFTLGYDVPANKLELIARIRWDGFQQSPEFEFRIDGTTVQQFQEDAAGNLAWSRNTVSSSIAAGSHTVRIQVADVDNDDAVGNGQVRVDLMGMSDSRFSYNFDNQVDSFGDLDGPELYPDAVTITTADVTALNQVVGGRCTASINDPNGVEKIELSNDSGGTYPISGTDTTSVDSSFPSDNSQIRARFTIGRHGTTNTETPNDGHIADALDSFTLFADQENVPALENRTFDDRLLPILQTIGSEKNFVWELRAQSGGGLSFEMAQPGQRSSDDDPAVGSYQVRKSTADIIEKAVIKGGRRETQEDFTSNHGSAVGLSEDDLIEGSEVVLDASTGTAFDRGADYTMEYLAGEITTLAAGNMSNSTSYRIRYDYRPQDSYAAPGVNEPKTVVRSLPNLQSEKTAENLAFTLVDKFSTPVYEATVEIPTSVGWSVIDEIDPSQVPTAGRTLQLVALDTTPAGIIARLETQRDPDDVVDRLRSRLSTTESRV